MKSEAGRFALPSRLFFPFNRSGLRARMTISYMSVTLGSVLSFMILTVLVSGALSALFSGTGDRAFLAAMQQQAQSYALVAAVQAQGVALDPQTNFIPGHAHTIALPGQENQEYRVFAPYIATASSDPTSVSLALLIAPDGRLVVSSYPSRYPAGMPVSALLPEQMRAIGRALAGQTSTGTEHLSSVTLGYAAEPVWSKDHQPIGAIFLQVPGPDRGSIFSQLGSSVSLSNIVLLVLVTPVGVFFGWITTRSLVRRVQQLVLATTQFAAGDYTPRVISAHRDEIGRLEEQFNHMAEQLVEHISRRQQLAEQHARLAERARISRELHDAISQDLFSLSMLAGGLQSAVPTDSPFQRQIATLELTTNKMIREMRALLLELRPTSLEHLSLDEALAELAAAYRTRLSIGIHIDLTSMPLEARIEHALLRITQEALSNAARHAHATEITLTLAPCGEAVELCIHDNGRGFNTEDPSLRHGLGLHLLQERVEELHGSLQLESSPGVGTALKVRVPLEESL
jgi:two-component system, NarL family, sensor histidine kinase LiaS